VPPMVHFTNIGERQMADKEAKKIKYKDYPFAEIAEAAERLADEGHRVYQKFSCAQCGQRLTMDVPNVMYKTGACDKCGHITNIEAQGCNYLLITLDASARPCVMRVVEFAAGEECPVAGHYLKSFDFDAYNGQGYGEFTANIEQAMKFPNRAAAMEFWGRQSTIKPLRPDGLPNKPLTSTTMSIEPYEG